MTTLAPKEPYASDPLLLLALCVWREARGESIEAKAGVVNVINNRCAMSPAQGFKASTTGNILHPGAFSSFNEDDSNSTKYPAVADPSWQNCLAVARSAEADTTGGAVFYFSPPLTQPPHAWGPVEHSATIGNLQFYRIIGS